MSFLSFLIPKRRPIDLERHHVAGWVFAALIAASVFVAAGSFLGFGLSIDSVGGSLLMAAVFLVLALFHRAKFVWPKFVMVTIIALIASFSYPEPYVTHYAHIIVLLPVILAALVLDELSQIVSTAAFTLGILLLKAKGQGVYASPEILSIFILSVVSLIFSRYLLEKRSQKLQKANDELSKRDAIKTKYVKVISHELQTPLSEIHVSASMLLDDSIGKLSAIQQKMAEVIVKSSSEAIDRITAMSVILDADEHGISLSKKSAKLTDLVHSILVSRGPAIKAKGFKLVNRAAELPALEFDLDWMRMAITRLLDNAIMYTPQNGTITITLESGKDGQKLAIADTGIGVPKAEQNNLFEAFTRASNAFLVSPDGEGVGLAVAKHIIEQHGGRIGFESEEGKGSTFWLELPDASPGESQPSPPRA